MNLNFYAMSDFKDLLGKVTTFIFDFDGVMTDGSVFVDANGEALRISNVKDGYALHLANKLGYNTALISGAYCPTMINRMNALGTVDVYIGEANKVERLESYMKEKGLTQDQVAYMGDDIPDMRAMKRVGVPVCPADAAPEIKEICCYVSPYGGGKGCVRDIIEQTLKVQGRWMSAEAYSW